MKWFIETFLPSLDKQLGKNPKYPNQMILSEKQLYICEKYMTEKSCTDCSYKVSFSVLQFETGGFKYQVTYRGKYAFLSKSNK